MGDRGGRGSREGRVEGEAEETWEARLAGDAGLAREVEVAGLAGVCRGSRG